MLKVNRCVYTEHNSINTGQIAYTLTTDPTNFAKLTADQIAIATNKNWNLA